MISAEQPIRRFPTLSGQNLEGRKFEIPGDLAGELNLVVVAFLQDQQTDVDAWLKAIELVDYPNVEAYEIPLLRRLPRFYQRRLNEGMAEGIPDQKAREHTITVYTNRRAFLQSAGLHNEKEVWATLIRRDGTVLWTHLGRPTSMAIADLRQSLTE